MFHPAYSETPIERVPKSPAILGLLTAACVAWLACPRPEVNTLSWVEILVWSTGYLTLCITLGVALTWASASMLAADYRLSRVFPWRLVVTMLWLPPLAVFLVRKSSLAALAAMVIAWQVLKLPLAQTETRSDASDFDEIFRSTYLMESFAFVPSIASLAFILCTYGGIATTVRGRYFATTALVSIGTMALAWATNRFRLASEASPRAWPRPRRGLLPLACALILTCVALAPYLRRSGYGQYGGSATADLDGTLRGVILLPESEIKASIIAPKPRSLTPNPFSKPLTDQYSIPFFGVYWLFRWPEMEPPPGSYVAKASPLDSHYFVTDRMPLRMEARQNFGQLIDLSCCSKIQIELSSAEPSATLDLTLINTTAPGKPKMLLGANTLKRSASASQTKEAPPEKMLASFDIPLTPKIAAFDEASIAFNRGFASKANAKVAIERFIFIPR